MAELVEADRRILDILQADCRLSNQEIADRVGLSASACWRRTRALEEAGIIKRYAAVIDAEKAGLHFAAVLHVNLLRHDSTHMDGFVSRIVERPEVLECLTTTGDSDFHVKIVCADKEAYNRFMDDFLFRLPGLGQVRTYLVLKEVKSTTTVPLPR